MNKLILKFFSPNIPTSKNFGKCLHVLDLFRKSLLQHSPTHPTTPPIMPRPIIKAYKHKTQYDVVHIMRSASELRESGIRFRRSKTQSLKDVSFYNGILRLPTIVVDDYTESMLLNLVAFERLHIGAGNDVTSYVFFMDSIIDRDADVAILHRKQIIVNALGNDKAVAKLFNSMSRDVSVDCEGVLEKVQESVCMYCRKPWNKWRANLFHTYFTNPWAIVSLVGAFFLFLLSAAQTVFTVVQFYQPDGSHVTPMIIPRLPPWHH